MKSGWCFRAAFYANFEINNTKNANGIDENIKVVYIKHDGEEISKILKVNLFVNKIGISFKI